MPSSPDICLPRPRAGRRALPRRRRRGRTRCRHRMPSPPSSRRAPDPGSAPPPLDVTGTQGGVAPPCGPWNRDPPGDTDPGTRSVRSGPRHGTGRDLRPGPWPGPPPPSSGRPRRPQARSSRERTRRILANRREGRDEVRARGRDGPTRTCRHLRVEHAPDPRRHHRTTWRDRSRPSSARGGYPPRDSGKLR